MSKSRTIVAVGQPLESTLAELDALVERRRTRARARTCASVLRAHGTSRPSRKSSGSSEIDTCFSDCSQPAHNISKRTRFRERVKWKRATTAATLETALVAHASERSADRFLVRVSRRSGASRRGGTVGAGLCVGRVRANIGCTRASAQETHKHQ